jgi:hypothetical protein
MERAIKSNSTEYEKPIVMAVDVCIERGFEASSQLDDMTENEGSWY